MKGGKVFLRCAACGNAKIVESVDSDPEGTYIVVTNLCDICDRGGGFEEVWYYDTEGKPLEPK